MMWKRLSNFVKVGDRQKYTKNELETIKRARVIADCCDSAIEHMMHIVLGMEIDLFFQILVYLSK